MKQEKCKENNAYPYNRAGLPRQTGFTFESEHSTLAGTVGGLYPRILFILPLSLQPKMRESDTLLLFEAVAGSRVNARSLLCARAGQHQTKLELLA